MSDIGVIDLAKLPPPDVVEPLDYETLVQAYYADFLTLAPGFNALLESDPAMILLQASAYRELLLRNRINEAAKANLLAYAMGADLDQKAAGYGVTRLPDEDDDRLRYRCQLSLEGYSTAGPIGAYCFHALSASIKVKSVDVYSPSPGVVTVTVLSNEGDGIPRAYEACTDVNVTLDGNTAILDGKAIKDLVVKDATGSITYTDETDYVFDEINSLLMRTMDSAITENATLLLNYQRADVLTLVRLALNDENTRPLTDYVNVNPALIIPYHIKADIIVYPGPSFSVVEDEGRRQLDAYVDERNKMGGLVALSGIYNALHTDGVKAVEIASPLADVATTHLQAPFCTHISLTTRLDENSVREI